MTFSCGRLWALCLAILLATVQLANGWTYGRATFYGDQPWLWSIHYGSCGKGYIWPDISPTGWDVVALPDSYGGNCGGCYEVACDDRDITDAFGQSLGRSGICFDTSASVVVSTTDTCPCEKSDNYYSNSRWCCGDQAHLDLSVYAFEKLADKKWGVIGIKYQEVACGTQPTNAAPTPSNAFPGVYPDAGTYRADFDWGKYFGNGGIDRNGNYIPLAQFQSQAGKK